MTSAETNNLRSSLPQLEHDINLGDMKYKSNNKGTLSTTTLADNLPIDLGLIQVRRNR